MVRTLYSLQFFFYSGDTFAGRTTYALDPNGCLPERVEIERKPRVTDKPKFASKTKMLLADNNRCLKLLGKRPHHCLVTPRGGLFPFGIWTPF